MRSSFGKILASHALLGGMLGYLIFHPASMVIMAVTQNPTQLGWQLIGTSFSPPHVPMALYFTGLGIATGAVFALANRRLAIVSRKVQALEGLLPICSNCKKIRTASESTTAGSHASWVPVEQYVSARSAAEFSHSICPGCMEVLYPEFGRRIEPDS